MFNISATLLVGLHISDIVAIHYRLQWSFAAQSVGMIQP